MNLVLPGRERLEYFERIDWSENANRRGQKVADWSATRFTVTADNLVLVLDDLEKYLALPAETNMDLDVQLNSG